MIQDIEAFWDELLAYIEDKSVIPVIGSDIAIVGSNAQMIPFEKLLARQLALKFDIVEITDDLNLHKVVCNCFGKLGTKPQTVNRELANIAGKLYADLIMPEPFLQLARILDFNLFVNFCTDSLLARSLNQVRFDGMPQSMELSFAPNNSNDLPVGNIQAPIIYSLFGQLSLRPESVIAEEDIIEWIAALQVPDKRPSRLFDELSKNHLLFLGCSFPDWLTRFILRTAKNSKLSSGRGYSEYLVDSGIKKGDPLVVFLSSFSQETQILPMDPVQFVAELEQRWTQRNGGKSSDQVPDSLAMPKIMPAGSVFISYASEDLDAALQVASELHKTGVPVWLDKQRLDWSSDYSVRIKNAIQNCSLFLPILSRNAEKRPGFFRKEWAWAVEKNLEFTGSSLKFIYSLSIDDAKIFDSTEIPDVFKSRHIEFASGGKLNTEQCSAIQEGYRGMLIRMGGHS